MKRTLLSAVLALGFLGAPGLALADDWKNTPIVDGNCQAKPEVMKDPDSHPTSCALKCASGGFGTILDGKYVKFDDKGNKKALALLKKTKKADHLRADVTGTLDGDTIKVKSIKLD